MSDEIKDYFLMERRLVRTLSPIERLVYLEFCERARWNGNVTNKLGIELPKGGFIFGFRELSKRTGGTLQQVRTAVKNLTHLQHISNTRSTHRGSEFYLCRLGVILQPLTHSQHRPNTDLTTNIPIPIPIPIISNKRRRAEASLVAWEEIKESVRQESTSRHGYSEAFFESQWVALLAYDQERPYKMRRMGALNWFNGKITREKWVKERPVLVTDPLMDFLGEEHAKMVAARKLRLGQK